MSFGGFGGLGGQDIGSALVRVGADFSGLRAQTHAAVTQMRAELATATKGLNVAPNTGVQQLSRDLDTATHKARGLSTAMKGIMLGGGLVAMLGIGAAIKAAIDFESAFAGVEKTVEGTKAELAELREEFLGMAREMPVAATSLARIGEAAGALGVPKAAIKDFVKVVSTIGSTTDVSVDDAATSLGQLSNILKMTEDDYGRFAATLVDLGNKGASTESQILEIAKRFGGSAKLFGLQAKEVLALASSAANLGMQPELAGSTLSRLSDRLTSISGAGGTVRELAEGLGMTEAKFIELTEAGGDSLDALADATGLQSKQLTSLLKSADSLSVLQRAIGLTDREYQKLKSTDPAAIWEAMFRAMSGMDASARQLFMGGVMGPAASGNGGAGMNRLVMGLADSIDKNLTPSLQYANQAWEDQTAAVNEANKRYATTASQWQMIQNLMTDVLIRAGSTFLPTVVAGLSALAEKVPQVFEALGQLYVKHLEGPFTQLRAALTVVGTALGAILFDWGGGGAGESVGGVFTVIATAVGALATQLAVVVDVMGNLLGNPVMQGLGKMVVMLGAVTIALKGLAALRGMFGSLGTSMLGLGRGALNTLTLGRMGGTTTAVDPATAMQQGAAKTQMAAAEMQLRAAGMEAGAAANTMASARALGLAGMDMSAAAPGPRRNPVLLPGGTRTQPIQMLSSGYEPTRNRLASQGWFGGVGASSPYLSPYTAATSKAAMAPVAKTMLQRVTGGLTGALATGARGIGSLVGTGLSLVSKVFWPLFLVDLVANLAAAPIGDHIRRTTGWKRLADQWSKGWVEGLAATAQTLTSGDDVFVGRQPEFQLGERTISTKTLETLAGRDADKREEIGAIMDAVSAAESDFDLLAKVAEMGKWVGERVATLPKAPPHSADLLAITESSLSDLNKKILDEASVLGSMLSGDGEQRKHSHELWVDEIDALARTLPNYESLPPMPDAAAWEAGIKDGTKKAVEYMDAFNQWSLAVHNAAVDASRVSEDMSDGLNQWASQVVANAKELNLPLPEGLEESVNALFLEGAQTITPELTKVLERLSESTRLRLVSMAKEGQALFRDAIVESARQAGMDIPAYKLAGLPMDVLERVGSLFQHELPAGLEWFREWNLKRISGLDAKPYGVGDTPAQVAGVEGRQKDIVGLGSWMRQQRETIGAGQWEGARSWMDQFGKRIEDTDAGTDAERAEVIFDVTGKKLNPKNKKAIDRQWKLVSDHLSGMKALLGIDQREAIAQQTQDGLTAAIGMGFDGVSIDPTTWRSLGTLMYDGLGDRTEEVGQRIADAVTAWYKAGARGIDWEGVRQEYNKANKGKSGFAPIPEGKKGGKPDPKLVAYWRQQQIDALNAAMKNAPGWVDIKPGDWKSFRSAVLASYVDDLESADNAKEKEDIQKALQKLFPGEFMEWKDVVDAIEAPTTQQWATRFETMGATASSPAEDLGGTLAAGVAAGVAAADMGMFKSPKPDLEGAKQASKSMVMAAQAYANANPIVFTAGEPRREFWRGLTNPKSDNDRDADAAPAGDDGPTGGGSLMANLRSAVSAIRSPSLSVNVAAARMAAPVPAYAGTAMNALAAMPRESARMPRSAMAPSFAPAASRMAAASGGAPPMAQQQAPQQQDSGSRNQSLFVQQMTVLGPESETGILRQLSFMSPG